MSRKTEFFRLAREKNNEADNLPKNYHTIASRREINWWLQFQTQRALEHWHAGTATRVEKKYLKNRGLID